MFNKAWLVYKSNEDYEEDVEIVFKDPNYTHHRYDRFIEIVYAEVKFK